MLDRQQLIICLYIFVPTIYITWSFSKIYAKLWQVAIKKASGFKHLFFAFLYFSPIIVLSVVYPDYPEEYFITSFWFFLSFNAVLSIRRHLNRKKDLGDILFKSKVISKLIYLPILFIPFIIWMTLQMYSIWIGEKAILNKIDTIQPEIVIKLYCFSSILMLLLFIAYMFVISWHQLEIREQGFWYMDKNIWQDIKGYCWSEKKDNLLVIIYSDRKCKLKINILPEEKEPIEKILTKQLV